MRAKTVRATAGGGACALLLLLSACSGDNRPVETSATTTDAQSQADAAPASCINGRTAPDAKIDRPAIALKVENSPEARPQSGLQDADIVYEEIVEGGITRFLALFHCGDSAKAGPVRSARFDDPKLALPFTSVLAYSGSNSIVDKELTKRDIVSLNELNGGDAFFRVPEGSTDIHSLYADSGEIRAQAPDKVDSPDDGIFSFGDVPEDAAEVRSVRLNFTSGNTIEYKWGSGAWQRFEAGEPFMSSGGDQIEVANLVIQQVKVDNSEKIVDPAGNPSPDILLKGTGKAVLLRDGRAIKGTWKIAKEGTAPVFETPSGDPFPFARGTIWVELVPSKKGDVKGSFALE